MDREGLSMSMTYVVIGVIVLFVALAVIPGQAQAGGLFDFASESAEQAGDDFSQAQEGEDPDNPNTGESTSTPGPGDGGGSGGGSGGDSFDPAAPDTFSGCEVNC